MGDDVRREALNTRIKQKMAKEGLIKVIAIVDNFDQSTKSQIYADVESFFDAIEEGNFIPLNFNDSYEQMEFKF